MAHINEQGRLVYVKITRLVTVFLNYQAEYGDGSGVDDSIWVATLPQKLFRPRSNSTHSAWGVWVDGVLWVAECTSRNRNGKGSGNGARWIEAEKLMPDKKHSDRWILQEESVEVEYITKYKVDHRSTPEYQIERMIHRANSMMGIGYDLTGVTLGFANPYRAIKKRTVADVIKRGKDYCSAFVELIRQVWTVTISPQRLFRKTAKRGCRVIKDTFAYINGS